MNTRQTLIVAALSALFAATGAAHATIAVPSDLARVETEKPQKPEKKEKVGATTLSIDLARVETEKPQKPEKKEKIG